MTPYDTSHAIPQEPDGPPFAEPWHGQVFALTVQMARAGHFTWLEWTAAFAANLAGASAAGAPKDASRYYEVWLDTFEQLLTARGLAEAALLRELKQAWTEAYLHTPHGQPLALDRKTLRHDRRDAP